MELIFNLDFGNEILLENGILLEFDEGGGLMDFNSLNW